MLAFATRTCAWVFIAVRFADLWQMAK